MSHFYRSWCVLHSNLFFGLGYRMQEDGKVNFEVLKVGILKISVMN